MKILVFGTKFSHRGCPTKPRINVKNLQYIHQPDDFTCDMSLSNSTQSDIYIHTGQQQRPRDWSDLWRLQASLDS